MRVVFIVSALVAAVATPVSAQQVTQVIGATQEVHDIAQHGESVLLATSGGLVVRRGGHVVDTLVPSRLRSVSVTSRGVWVGGVEALTLLNNHLEVQRQFPLRRVRRVVERNGVTWIAGYDGLHRLDGETPTQVTLGRTHARQRLTDALVVGEELWVASAGAGILRVSDRLMGRMTRASGLEDDLVWDLELHDGGVLAATASGVSFIRNGRVVRNHAIQQAARNLSVRDVRSIEAHGGSVYATTFGGGTYRLGQGLVRGSRTHAPHGLRVAHVSEGWVVGHLQGLAQLGSRTRALMSGGLPSADVSALERAFGRVWIGTFDRGLAQLRDGQVQPVGRAQERWNIDGRVNDLAVTRRGGERLWIATDRGLYWHDGRRFAHVEDPRAPGRVHVTSMHVDARGRLWVTSSRQLSRWDGSWQSWNGNVTAGGTTAPLAQLHSVTTMGDDVWVGSLHGLFQFDEGGAHRRHTVSSGDLPVDWVTALTVHRGQLVAGTYHGGLSWKTGRGFRTEGESHGLPAGWVNPHAMKTIEGRLWIGTLERGLLIGNRGSWTHLQLAQGLPSDDVTDFLADDEGVWVATRGGLARIE